MLIHELSRPGRTSRAQQPRTCDLPSAIPLSELRGAPLELPEVSELDVVRHYTRLSQRNYSIDTEFYPLGSCTMKYNPRACNAAALLPQFLALHPAALEEAGQGFLACMHELQEMLARWTGMAAVSLAPMAGAQGEFAGVAMIRAYHEARGDHARREILVPDAAHGTNPATATMCGYVLREIRTGSDGDVDVGALAQALGPQTAGLMLTNPSTLGVFERGIGEIANIVHAAGGLLYYDGANLNAILGKVRPGAMGFDVLHLNLHKTFSTPHGGGGPGAGPVAAAEHMAPYLPVPLVARVADRYRLLDASERAQTIGRLSAHAGQSGVLLRAYVYARMLGDPGARRVAEFATLNANYLMHELAEAGFDLAFPRRRASHEFIVTLKRLKERTAVSAMDFAKRLLDKGCYAPTTYFPLLVPECLLIEPTETESKQTLDAFVGAMKEILHEAETDPQLVKSAPHTLPVRRLDEVRAARELDLAWTKGRSSPATTQLRLANSRPEN
ncbi:MAG: aminomethyl-transferring glycine dehydrogenase subunit GcvPB [Burkholderiales bacterium]|nr:aminomethyl-transferring glycine dehydrogenase subunit GcvPB [Burkholderiales bacterium]